MFAKSISWLFLLYFFVSSLFSCTANRYTLNQKERDFVNHSDRQNRYAILFDNRAIRNQRDNGTYTVQVSHTSYSVGLCSMDTASIKGKAIEVARQVVQVMSFREHYRFIDVQLEAVFSPDMTTDKNGSTLCRYVVRMPVANIAAATMVSSTNTYDPAAAFRR